MDMTKQEYRQLTERLSPPSPAPKDCLKAFLIGGLICALGECIFQIAHGPLGLDEKGARLTVSVVLIAKHAGAGTIVPITGFANSVVAPAIEFKDEGFVLGLGAKMFVIAGPVLVYGISSGVLYGLILYIVSLFS